MRIDVSIDRACAPVAVVCPLMCTHAHTVVVAEKRTPPGLGGPNFGAARFLCVSESDPMLCICFCFCFLYYFLVSIHTHIQYAAAGLRAPYHYTYMHQSVLEINQSSHYLVDRKARGNVVEAQHELQRRRQLLLGLVHGQVQPMDDGRSCLGCVVLCVK